MVRGLFVLTALFLFWLGGIPSQSAGASLAATGPLARQIYLARETVAERLERVRLDLAQERVKQSRQRRAMGGAEAIDQKE